MNPAKVDYTNRRPSPGRGRTKHIFLEEREQEAAHEFGKDQTERDERLEAHYNRRKRTPFKRK